MGGLFGKIDIPDPVEPEKPDPEEEQERLKLSQARSLAKQLSLGSNQLRFSGSQIKTGR